MRGMDNPASQHKASFFSGQSAWFRVFFGRRLKTNEAHSQQVTPLAGIPILGLDALGSASYGPEAALTILIPLGMLGLNYVREIIAAILVLLAILFFHIGKPSRPIRTAAALTPSRRKISANTPVFSQRRRCCWTTF